MRIGQSAAKPRTEEGSTTIPYGSRIISETREILLELRYSLILYESKGRNVYPGTRLEKLLDSQIGNMLSSKLGGREGLERLIDEGKIELLPFSDIRGFDTTGMRAGVYITEAQNLSRSLMKLALQRIGEDCICIIDGDNNQQVDMRAYEGSRNGMRRLSKVFRGSNIYGEVKLSNIYRSQIASIAEKI